MCINMYIQICVYKHMGMMSTAAGDDGGGDDDDDDGDGMEMQREDIVHTGLA